MAQKFKTKEDFDRFRADWEMVYAVAHKAPILENDIKYKQIGISLKDSQLLETRLFSIHEICRWFGVPPHLVGDLSRATFSNIEQLALEFVKLTLSAWLTRWEQELWRCVLTPEEKNQNYLWRHNLNALLRGDFPSRMTGYATMLQNGIACQDEIRDLEDWNPIEDGIGTGYHIQLNMQTLPPDGGPLQPPKGPAKIHRRPTHPLPTRRTRSRRSRRPEANRRRHRQRSGHLKRKRRKIHDAQIAPSDDDQISRARRLFHRLARGLQQRRPRRRPDRGRRLHQDDQGARRPGASALAAQGRRSHRHVDAGRRTRRAQREGPAPHGPPGRKERIPADQSPDRQRPVHRLRHREGRGGRGRSSPEGDRLWEGSIVTFPMNEMAQITSVKARKEAKADFSTEYAEIQLQDAMYQMWIALRYALSSIPWSDMERDEKIAASAASIEQFTAVYMEFIPAIPRLAHPGVRRVQHDGTRPPRSNRPGSGRQASASARPRSKRLTRRAPT
jgi:Trp operon repressor